MDVKPDTLRVKMLEREREREHGSQRAQQLTMRDLVKTFSVNNQVRCAEPIKQMCTHAKT